ncbi:MAG TPA: DUF4097 family beta strand repeat-containing protein [Dactylosporangium sp.]|nr:DUF4097 family beta strand repeat-containing protein [Dactylosporangium sp.]
MPTFETPEAIAVTVELGVGHLKIAASERADTVVEVRPSDDSDESDVKAAQQIRVDYANGTLRVTGPRRTFDFSRKTKSVDVTIELPAGSRVSADVQAGDVRSTGLLGRCRLKTGIGDVGLERTGPLHLDTGAGHVSAGEVDGDADISTGTGNVQIGEIDGTAVIKNSNGATTVDRVAGDARVRAANGEITIGRAGAGVDAKSSNGNIRVGEVVRGSVVLGTAMGDLSVGIAEGTAAWLELDTGFGRVHNRVDNAIGPDETDLTVEVRARTSYGDITIHRA